MDVNNNVFISLLNNHALEQEKRFAVKPFTPWYNERTNKIGEIECVCVCVCVCVWVKSCYFLYFKGLRFYFFIKES